MRKDKETILRLAFRRTGNTLNACLAVLLSGAILFGVPVNASASNELETTSQISTGSIPLPTEDSPPVLDDEPQSSLKTIGTSRATFLADGSAIGKYPFILTMIDDSGAPLGDPVVYFDNNESYITKDKITVSIQTENGTYYLDAKKIRSEKSLNVSQPGFLDTFIKNEQGVYEITLPYTDDVDIGSNGTMVYAYSINGDIAYCYDRDKIAPPRTGTPYYPGEDFRGQGGADEERIRALLYVGYPFNATGLMQKYQVSDDVAQFHTQQALWAIITGEFGQPSGYYGELIAQSAVVSPTEPGELVLTNDGNPIDFHEKDGYYETSPLSLIGYTGKFSLSPSGGVSVWDLDGNERDTYYPGEQFVLRSKTPVNTGDKMNFGASYSYVYPDNIRLHEALQIHNLDGKSRDYQRLLSFTQERDIKSFYLSITAGKVPSHGSEIAPEPEPEEKPDIPPSSDSSSESSSSPDISSSSSPEDSSSSNASSSSSPEDSSSSDASSSSSPEDSSSSDASSSSSSEDNSSSDASSSSSSEDSSSSDASSSSSPEDNSSSDASSSSSSEDNSSSDASSSSSPEDSSSSDASSSSSPEDSSSSDANHGQGPDNETSPPRPSNTPSRRPSRTPSPGQPSEPVAIPDEPVPLAPPPETVIIEDEDVPLAQFPPDVVVIENEDVPLGQLPLSGGKAASASAFFGSLALIAGISNLSSRGKKK